MPERSRGEELLEDVLARRVRSGARVEARTPTSAVLVYGKPISHVLHLLLTILTAGLWAIVWLSMRGERRRTVRLNSRGEVIEQSKRCWGLLTRTTRP